MEHVDVPLDNNSYTINIGDDIIDSKYLFPLLKKGDRVVLVTNNVVSDMWKNTIVHYLLQYRIIIDEFILPDGEKYKNLHSVESLLSFLLKKKHDRNSILISLGGGVIGDLTGFVASVYQRGIRFLQIPTTLLAQVDASVGGKTGVNHVLGKNMIGSFWQPIGVIIDTIFLSTLSTRQLVSGFAEVIKYAISFDYEFFVWLEKNLVKLSVDSKKMLYCIKKCCQLKSKIVNLDEREKKSRMLLNFGHTYGHAIETHFRYSTWSHGDAIAVGMIIASKTAEIIGLLKSTDTKRILKLIYMAGLPIMPPKNMYAQEYLKYMERDKKNISGGITLILPTSIGKVEIFNNIKKDVIVSSIQSFL
ncbi:3-dehydroquinate synthase [Buchnera aphidicola (Myzocallis carpini)]